MIHRIRIPLSVAVVGWIVLIGGGCTDLGEQAMFFVLQSPAFKTGEPIPVRYTGDGDDVSPPLQWLNVPDGAKELALIVDDPDAPTARPWVHWVIYRIPVEWVGLPEAVVPGPLPPVPLGVRQGSNSWAEIGYRGPAPPPGGGVHHYHFRLYALSRKLTLSPSADKTDLLRVMKGHILAETELIGAYQR